jgi:RNA polymerase sigma-70 factor (ECF subfamily)
VRDEQGFEELYAAVFGRLVGQLDLVTGDLQDAEDAVQEALTRAAVRWGRLRAYAVPEAWVRRVAMNLASNGFRRARRRLAEAVAVVDASG